MTYNEIATVGEMRIDSEGDLWAIYYDEGGNMYIAPNTNIRVLKNVPLDNTYRNTIYFGNATNQLNYFLSKQKYAFNNQTYQRVNNGVMTLNRSADDLYDCNYLMFQNPSYGNKWFYAFILSVEYIGNTTAEVRFEIDIMQTWHFDYTVNMSFVEREMSITDKVGDNLVPENLELGEYIYKDLGISSLFTLYQIIVAATFDENLEDATGGMYGGVYSGLHYNVFSTWQSASTFIADATEQNKADGIVSIFMLPVAFTADYQATIPEAFTIERDKHLSDIDGYIPKNNKLFTAPYNMLYVTNNEGGAANYPFEYFSTDNCTFKATGAMCCTPECMIIPLNYKGVANNYNEKLTIGNFPQCAFTVDTFKAWVAQNQNRIAYDAAIGIAQTVGGAAAMYATGGLAGGGTAMGGFEKISSLVATAADKSTLPPQARGGGGSIINMANQIKGFQFFYAYIRAEFAQIIDNYFNVYGYATHRVKIPNRAIRPHWNYVKTQNVSLTGSVPADDMARLRQIYDNGVTFWRNGNEVGDYSLDNRPSAT
jgi:hypothetical protein